MNIENLTILVTGGAGFIGSHVAERLAARNRVRIYDDFSTGSHDNIDSFADAPNVEVIEGTSATQASSPRAVQTATWCFTWPSPACVRPWATRQSAMM